MMRRHVSMACLAAAVLVTVAGCASGDPSAAATQRAGVQVRNDGLAGISGWEPVPNVCGTSSSTAVVITNTYGQPETLTITVNDDLSAQVGFFPTWGAYGGSAFAAGCQGRPLYYSPPGGYTQPVTIPANSTGYFVLAIGGLDYNLATTSHNIAIGAGGSAWYDFNLTLNADESFKSLQLQYQETGGTDPSQNVQTGLINVVTCNPTTPINPASPMAPSPTTTSLVSTYAIRAEVANQAKYDINAPICMAFLQPNSVG